MKNTYLRKDLLKPNSIVGNYFKKGKTMCKQSFTGTYLNVNALPDNAQTSFPLEYMFIGHYL